MYCRNICNFDKTQILSILINRFILVYYQIDLINKDQVDREDFLNCVYQRILIEDTPLGIRFKIHCEGLNRRDPLRKSRGVR